MLRTTLLAPLILLLLMVVAPSTEENVGTNMGLRILKRGGTQLERIMKTRSGGRVWRDMKRNPFKIEHAVEEPDDMKAFLLIL